MKKVFISGATGFIGSHLTELLIKHKYKVIAFDRYNINNSYGHLEYLSENKSIDFRLGDIRDYDSVKKSMEDCDIVIHMAALIGIPYSYVSPLAYIRTNIEGTYNILEASKELRIKKTLITSTSEVYGSAQYTPIDEKHPYVGQSPYSASKIAADQIALSYYKSFKLPLTIVRPFNTYGPRQSLRAIIPTITSQLLSKSKTVSIGNLNTVRDLTYVTDTCEAFLSIMKSKKTDGKILNIGSGQGISIEELYHLICKTSKITKKITIDKKRIRPSNSEVNQLVCNFNNLKKITKWTPKISLKEGVKQYIKNFKKIEKYENKNYYVEKSNKYNV